MTRGAAGRIAIAALAAVTALAATGCSDAPSPDDVLALRREVNALRDSLAATGWRPTSVVADAPGREGDVVIGLATSMVVDVLSAASALYLSDVRLHLRKPVVVGTSGDVRVSLGLFDVSAGSWDLDVTIERIDARLSADSIILAVADSQRVAVTVPVQVLDGGGDAVIDFRWDASRVTSVVCGDFAVRERFAGTVEPRTHRVEGWFVLEPDSAGLRAVPVVRERVSVSPRPTDASWARVRRILAEQDRIFNCGLAISRESMEARLRELLERGFRFSLPTSILRPVPLPASMADRIQVAGRTLGVSVEARAPRLGPEWIWLAAGVEVSASSSSRMSSDDAVP